MMVAPIPPVPPSQGREVTPVQSLRGFRVVDSSPPWGGPAEAT
jgi:hypothetical protein